MFAGQKTKSQRKIIAFVIGVVVCMCCRPCIPLILDVRLVDVPAGVTQDENHTGFLHLLSAVLALIFRARRTKPFLKDHEVKFCVY